MQNMNDKYISLLRRTEQKNPWFWIPSLYVAKGLPYMVLMMLSLIMFKRLGMGNAEITLWRGTFRRFQVVAFGHYVLPLPDGFQRCHSRHRHR